MPEARIAPGQSVPYGTCFDFAKGLCTRGTACKFSHGDGMNPLPTPSVYAGTKLFIGGLPPVCSTEELRAYFAMHGTVTDAIVMERDGVPRGFGFVTFATDEEAVACLQRGPHVMKGKQIDAKRADLNRPRMS